MKRLFVLMMVLMVGVMAQAEQKALTLQDFIAQKKAAAEKKGSAFDEAAVKAAFERKDIDKDGKLSAQEQNPAPKLDKVPAK